MIQEVFANHIFQTLSIALINSIWQMALLWLVYNAYQLLFSSQPRKDFFILVALQIFGFAWFVFTIFSIYQNNTFSSFLTITTQQQFNLFNTFFIFIGLIYVLVLTYTIVKFFLGIQTIHHLQQKNVINISNDWLEILNKLTTTLDIHKKIQLKLSTNISTPLTIGVFKPIILLPIASLNQLTLVELEAILLHELAHIKRNDYLLNLFLTMIDAFMFFNPFSQSIKKHIQLQRELCCDDIVLEHHYSSLNYANALLNIAKQNLSKNHHIFTLNAIGTKYQLLHRVDRMLSNPKNNFLKPKFQFTITLLVGISFFYCVSFIGNINHYTPQNKRDNLKSQVPKSDVLIHSKSIEKSVIVFKKFPTKISSKKLIVKNKSEKQNEDIVINNSAEKEFLNESVKEFGINASFDDASSTEKTLITNAIQNNNKVTVQKFFIPATSTNPASVIIVTTTEKEDCKKTIQFEIVKGKGKVE